MPKTPVIKDWLADASKKLSCVGIETAKLDAEIILANVLGQNRTYLHAHDDKFIEADHLKAAEENLARRLKRMPIAYITGQKEFYGRCFFVNENTLIPRPESEEIINILKKIPISHSLYSEPFPIPQLIDIGTGSGCLGITSKLEFPNLDVTLIDISEQALEMASRNAQNLNAEVNLLESNLLENFEGKVDVIIANLPYVDKSWRRSVETDFEPPLALFADDNGLELIKKLIIQSENVLNPNGYLILEAEPNQHNEIINYAKKYYFKPQYIQGYILALRAGGNAVECR